MPRHKGLYRAYVLQEPDPAIEDVRKLFARSGMTPTRVSNRCGVTSTTLRKWFAGETFSPHHKTINAAAMALGQSFVLKAAADKDVKLTEKLEQQNAALRKQLAREAYRAKKALKQGMARRGKTRRGKAWRDEARP